MNEQLLSQQIDLLRASKTVYETHTVNWCPEDTVEALMVQDFEDFILAGVQHWQQICRIRDAFLAHESTCDKDHSSDYKFIESCIQHFQIKATAVSKILSQIEGKYEVENAAKFRMAMCEANLLTLDLKNLKQTTPLNKKEF